MNLVVLYIHENMSFSYRKMFNLVRKPITATPGTKPPNPEKATL